jgi:hypothetical protein
LNRLWVWGLRTGRKQTADICKQHLREKYPDKLGLVEEFIAEIDGPPKNCDVTRWSQFTEHQRHQKRDVSAARDSIRELAQFVKPQFGRSQFNLR